MPRPRTLYETVQADNIQSPSSLNRFLASVDGAMDAGKISRDAVLGTSPAMQPHRSTAEAVSSNRLADVLSAEPGDLNASEAGQPVLRQDREGITPQVGNTGDGRPLAGYPLTHAPQPSLGDPVGPLVQKEVVRLPDAGAGLIEAQVQQQNPGPESGEISAAGQDRRANGTAASASSPMQQKGPSVDPIRPTLRETLFHRMRSEGPVSTAVEQPPVVQIRIGRIEVKAFHPSATAPVRKVLEPPRSSLPLDQYLRRRVRET